jgi:PAS domain S-box-containing protein
MIQQLTVLIVDDSLEDREVYRSYLQQDPKFNYTILEAETGKDGLRSWQQFSPDIILLDFLLPGIDGLQFLAELKQQAGQQMPAAIMLTRQGNENIAVRAIKSGAQDYLVKGQITAEILHITIDSAIKNIRLEKNLRRSEERFRTSIDNLIDCFGIYSAVRNKESKIVDFRIDYLNPAACESNMMTPLQFGSLLSEVFPTARQTGLIDEYCRVVETGEPLVKESLVFTDVFGGQQLTRAYDFRISKMEDGFVASWRDVTARNQAQEQLRQTQQFIERIAEATPGLLYVYDLDRRHNVYVNRQIAEVLGYTIQEIDAMGDEVIVKLLHPRDLERLPQLLERCRRAADGEVLETEYQMRHKNSEWRWLYAREVIFTRNSDGSPSQIVGTAIDINYRKESEVALRDSEAKFRRIVESNIVGIYFGDVNGNIFEANDAFLEMFGYSRSELTGGSLRWDTMTPAEYLELDQQKVEEILQYGVCTPFEKEYFHKDGTRVPILLGIARIEGREDDGYSVCFVINLTLLKQTEAALRQSEKYYRYLSETIPQIIWISNSKGECEYVNPRWYEFSGQPIGEALGFGWRKILHPEDCDRMMRAWNEAVNSSQPYEIELRYRCYDGSYHWHLDRALPMLDKQGKIIKWFGTSTNINEHKQLEAERNRLLELEKNARVAAETANLAKDEFVAMVSHDLRSPLNAILGWAKLLRTQKLDADATHRALETIERNAKSQAKLLEDLLDISRILRNKLQLELSTVNLRAIIADALETAYPAANGKNIRFITVIDDSIPSISGDSNRLQQVFGNLLSNAIKFTPQGGCIEVYLSLEANNYAQIEFKDTGIGMSPEFLPQVFERYQQGKDSKIYGGLGLGLAIARQIIELHGGSICATSAGVGQGSTFTIQLPLSI